MTKVCAPGLFDETGDVSARRSEACVLQSSSPDKILAVSAIRSVIFELSYGVKFVKFTGSFCRLTYVVKIMLIVNAILAWNVNISFYIKK